MKREGGTSSQEEWPDAEPGSDAREAPDDELGHTNGEKVAPGSWSTILNNAVSIPKPIEDYHHRQGDDVTMFFRWDS